MGPSGTLNEVGIEMGPLNGPRFMNEVNHETWWTRSKIWEKLTSRPAKNDGDDG